MSHEWVFVGRIRDGTCDHHSTDVEGVAVLKNVLPTVALLPGTFIVLASLGYFFHQPNRGGHTSWWRRISLAIVLDVLGSLVVGLSWIW